ncbi:MAG: helix-turn-helix transcriptional regulator [Candidatus Eremiobacteraeota bacterium]|nr:helix-turn-helix transcriptional regulator [Candidatus Eremiobacteraeota bacterium]
MLDSKKVTSYQPGEYSVCVRGVQRCGPITLTETLHPTGNRLPPHAHKNASWALVLGGEFAECSDSEQHCKSGTILVRSSGQIHADHFFETSHCLNVEIDINYVAPNLKAVHRVLSRVFEKFIRSADNSEDTLANLMHEIAGRRDFGGLVQAIPEWLNGARRIATNDRETNHSVISIAREVGIHPTHLSRSYRAFFGKSILQDLRDSRVAHAKNLMFSGMPASQAAAQAGFADQSHMIKVFRTALGMTPAECASFCGRTARTKEAEKHFMAPPEVIPGRPAPLGQPGR